MPEINSCMGHSTTICISMLIHAAHKYSSLLNMITQFVINLCMLRYTNARIQIKMKIVLRRVTYFAKELIHDLTLRCTFTVYSGRESRHNTHNRIKCFPSEIAACLYNCIDSIITILRLTFTIFGTDCPQTCSFIFVELLYYYLSRCSIDAYRRRKNDPQNKDDKNSLIG
jgi:hypothetical protein